VASVRLRPLREDEWPSFVERSKHGYVQSMVEHGGVAPEFARKKAERDFPSLLTDGLATEGHYILAVEDVDTGEAVGRVWFARREIDGQEGAFLYDIDLDERVRGQGLGRQAMLLLEEEVRANGLSRITLNVFGGNEVARGLYRSLGYAEAAVWMSKEV
jgi:ribosomal protein S18 acetylase RimI-like enzyme